MGWRGPMTRRQYIVWMAWLPYESAKIEFRKPERAAPAPPNPNWILTKEKIAEMRKQEAIARIQQSGGTGTPVIPPNLRAMTGRRS